MKIALVLSIIFLSNILCGEFESKCKGNAPCQSCAISYFCEYGNNEDMKEECYKHCFDYKIDYDQHSEVQKAKETKPHSLIQTKQEVEQGTIEKACKANKMCEECGISWGCNAPYLKGIDRENCWKGCLEEHDDYDAGHDSTLKQKETKPHSFLQAKQEVEQGTIEKACKANKMCEECGISWGCNAPYLKGIDRENCWKGCLDEHDDYDAGHDSTLKQKETKPHSLIQTKQEVEKGTIEKACIANKMCEECGISWGCNAPYLKGIDRENCWKGCLEEHDDYDAGHDSTLKQKETKPHSLIQTKQEFEKGTIEKACIANKMCEECGISWGCNAPYLKGIDRENCWKGCLDEHDDYDAGHDSTLKQKETKPHSLIQTKQEVEKGTIEKACIANKMCEECGISWGCNAPYLKGIDRENCWKGCLEEHDDYDAGHDSTLKQKETKPHSLIQTKQEVEKGTIEKACIANKMCEECGISWGCNAPYLKGIDRENCWKGCLEEHDDYDAGHDSTLKQKETKPHSLIQTKQEVEKGTIEKACIANKMCEECGISWGCNAPYLKGIDRENCWKGCLEEHDDYDAGHDSTLKQKETKPHSYIQLTTEQDYTTKDKCERDQACQACAISWQCNYGSKPEAQEECYKVCMDHKIDYDLHKDVQNAKEVQ